MLGTILICVIATLLIILYRRMVNVQNEWKQKGIPCPKPLPLIGNLLDYFLKRNSMAEVFHNIAFHYKDEPLIGAFNMSKPVLIINDVEYAEIIMIKEFSSFMDRLEDIPLEELRPLDKNLFFISGGDWKGVRSKLTPVFTTSKLKGMLPEIGRIFDKTFENINLLKTTDLKDIIEIFTLRVRASCVFGIDISKSGQDEEFSKRVKDISNITIKNILPRTAALWFPRIATKLNLSLFGVENEKYFVNVLLKSFKERTESKVVKHDFIQTLLELKQTGTVEVKQWTQDDDYLKTDEHHATTHTVVIDDDILVAQSFIFLVAGLETLIGTLTMLLVELTQNENVLNKLRKEIDSAIDTHKEFSFEALKEMDYLEACLKETMRIYSPVESLGRVCCKTYTLPNGYTIEKGTECVLPISKYQMDPQIFPNPTQFIPERYSEDSFPKCAYAPFGQGPRICIGMRFAMIEMKMFISKFIHKYNFSLDPRTELPVKTDKWFFIRKNVSPIFVNVTQR